MLSVIKLLILFVLFVVECESIGLALLDKTNIKIDIIALPIGMASFGCIYELLILPIQYFHLDSSLLKYALIVSFVIVFLIGWKELRNIVKHTSKRDVIIIFVFAVLFIINSFNLNIYGTDSMCSDNLFYIPFVNGISMDGIAVNGPMSNMYVNMSISRIYAFYGQLHFYGGISNLLKVDALITLNFFHIWYLILFYITNIYNIYIICTEYRLFKNINKYFLLIFLSASYLLVLFNNEELFVSTTTMLFVVVPLIFYLKDRNKGWLFLFVIFSIHAMSCRSTFIFLLAFFLLPYYLFLLFNNRFEIKENVYILVPTLFFLLLYMSYGKGTIILLFCLLILLVLILIIPIIVNKIGVKYTKYIYLFILIGLFVYFISKSLYLGNVSATWDKDLIFDVLRSCFVDFSFYSSFINSVYNLTYIACGTGLLIYDLYNKKPISYYVVHVITIFVLCLNSFVAPFIAQFLSSVYERLFWMWINPLLYLLILDELIETFNNIKIKKIVYYSLSLVLVLNISLFYFIKYFNKTNSIISTYKEKSMDISYFYRIGSTSYELGKIIDTYAEDCGLKTVSVAIPTNVINLSYVSNKIKLSPNMGDYYAIQQFMSRDIFKEKWNESNYEHPILFYLLEPYRFFDDWHIENDFNNIPDIGKMLKDSKTDIMVFNKWNNREETNYLLKEYLDSFSEMIYENELYYICKINK